MFFEHFGILINLVGGLSIVGVQNPEIEKKSAKSGLLEYSVKIE